MRPKPLVTTEDAAREVMRERIKSELLHRACLVARHWGATLVTPHHLLYSLLSEHGPAPRVCRVLLRRRFVLYEVLCLLTRALREELSHTQPGLPAGTPLRGTSQTYLDIGCAQFSPDVVIDPSTEGLVSKACPSGAWMTALDRSGTQGHWELCILQELAGDRYWGDVLRSGGYRSGESHRDDLRPVLIEDWRQFVPPELSPSVTIEQRQDGSAIVSFLKYSVPNRYAGGPLPPSDDPAGRVPWGAPSVLLFEALELAWYHHAVTTSWIRTGLGPRPGGPLTCDIEGVEQAVQRYAAAASVVHKAMDEQAEFREAAATVDRAMQEFCKDRAGASWRFLRSQEGGDPVLTLVGRPFKDPGTLEALRQHLLKHGVDLNIALDDPAEDAKDAAYEEAAKEAEAMPRVSLEDGWFTLGPVRWRPKLPIEVGSLHALVRALRAFCEAFGLAAAISEGPRGGVVARMSYCGAPRPGARPVELVDTLRRQLASLPAHDRSRLVVESTNGHRHQLFPEPAPSPVPAPVGPNEGDEPQGLVERILTGMEQLLDKVKEQPDRLDGAPPRVTALLRLMAGPDVTVEGLCKFVSGLGLLCGMAEHGIKEPENEEDREELRRVQEFLGEARAVVRRFQGAFREPA